MLDNQTDYSKTVSNMQHQLNSQNPLKQTLKILLVIAFGLVFYSVLSVASGMLTIHDYDANFLAQLRFLITKLWLPWAILSPVVVFLARRFPLSPSNWLPRLGLHVVFLLALSLLQVSILSYHYHFFETMPETMLSYRPWQHMGHFLFGDEFLLMHIIVYTVFIASFNLRNFYAEAKQRELEASILNQQLSESKLHALRMQINPHFLFNTLNVISVLVQKENKTKAAKLLEQLSAFFRQTLEESELQWVPLRKELDIVEQYLAIEQARFAERLNVQLSCEAEVEPISIPSMILQPIVENAVRHGIGEKEESGTVSVVCKRSGGRLFIQIEDDGAGCDFSDSNKITFGIGIKNVQQRLAQMYGDDHLFSIKGSVGEGVIVTIELPNTSISRVS
jgi:sensor histidine kinase YesM